MSYCIFCNGTEPHSKDLFVCSKCVCVLSGYGTEELKKAATKHDLSDEQLHFLGISRYVKATLATTTKKITPIKKIKKKGK